MPALSDTDLQGLKQQLEQRDAQLRAEVQAVRDEEADTPSAQARNQNEDQGELGEEHIRAEVRYAERERDLMELRDISEARERIADGSYGECVDCGRDIPLQRLHAQPSAKRCIPCQQAFEHDHPPLPRYAAGLG
jgi:RNA polymerase-binding protein DksA